MRIAVLSNPTSHSNRAAMPGIREIVSERSGLFHREINAISDVPALLREWAGQGLDLLIVNGGDGTIQAVMTEIINYNPFGKPVPLAVVPGGKTNMFAMDLGGAGKPAHVLKKVLALADASRIAGQIVERTLVGFRRAPGEPMVYGTFFGTAAVVRGVEYCRAHVYPLGLPNFVSHTIACVIIMGGALTRNHGPDSPFRADDIDITLDDTRQLSGRYFLILVSSLNRLILGMQPFSNRGDGHLNFLSIDHAPGVIFSAGAKALITRPREFSSKGAISGKVDRVKLRLDCPVTLDGEFFHPDPNTPIELVGDRSLPFVEL